MTFSRQHPSTMPVRPSYKEMRYDRQLRLWGDHGQLALEKARICLINATSTGCEILKNLILPGIHSFTVIDGRTVDVQDVGNNFFLDPSQIGLPRAKAVCDKLKELNPEVNGDCVFETAERLIEDSLASLKLYSVVIASGVSEHCALELSDFLWQWHVPFVICHAYGLVGYLRLAVRNYCTIESHPENAFPCLMLDRPSSELQKFADSIDVEDMPHSELVHVPYLVLLLKALQLWRRTVSDDPSAFPTDYSDKCKIKEILRKMQKMDDKNSMQSENFVEALNAVNVVLKRTTVPEEVLSLLTKVKQPHGDTAGTDTDATSLLVGSESDAFLYRFSVLCRALQMFIDNEGHGCLPLPGTLPDMTSDSQRYMHLQSIYYRWASADADTVHGYVQRLCKNSVKCSITLEETRLFCKNAAFIKVIAGRSLRQEFDKKTANIDTVEAAIEEGNPGIIWYFLLRAAERFHSEKGRYPGTNGIPIELDKNDLKFRLNSLLETFGASKLRDCDDYIQEMCRYGAAELYGTAAFIGGVAAQEVIKIITRQYVILNNTYIFDGNKGTGSTLLL